MTPVFQIKLIPIDQNVKNDIDPIFNEVWTWLLKNTKKYATTKGSKSIVDFYLAEALEDSWFEADDASLCYGFADPGGMCGTSSSISMHWFTISFLQLMEPLNNLAKNYGYQFEPVKLDLDGIITKKAPEQFIEIDGIVNHIVKTENSIQIINDNGFTDIADAGQEIQKSVSSLLESGLCGCPMCQKIRSGVTPVTVKSTAKKRPKEPFFKKLSTALRFPDYALVLHIDKECYIAPDIAKLKVLEKLSVYDGSYETLPSEIGYLPKLRELLLHPIRIECDIPDSIGGLDNLEVLDIHIPWGLYRIPESVGNLKNLKKLDVESNELKSIPESIGNLSSLEYLGISSPVLEELPQSIMKLTNLRELYFRDCKIIPKALENMAYHSFSNLESLTLWRCNIKSFPGSILLCKNLKSLNLNGSDIEVLPKELGSLQFLECLELERTKIKTIPGEIFKLIKLNRLCLGSPNLTVLDERIGNLVDLKTLNIRDSKITRLPKDIKNCTLLKTIYCDDEQREMIRKELDSLGMTNVEVH